MCTGWGCGDYYSTRYRYGLRAVGSCTASSYLWNDGVITRSRPISTFGTYWVKIYNGCGLDVDTIHVSPLLPDSITGPTAMCASTSVALTAGVPGGTWISTNTAIATIGSTGVVTGIFAGVSLIEYAAPGACPASVLVTVNPEPSVITWPATLCAGDLGTMTDGLGGGTWSSSNTAVASVIPGVGVVTGVSAGSAVISYTVGSSCPPATASMVVFPLPAAISGTTTICAGATSTLSDATGGGAWSSGVPGVATVGSGSGVVTGNAGGETTITYSLGTGCYTTTGFTVNVMPVAISGASPLCAGTTSLFSDGTAGGAWSSSNTAVATITATGTVTAVSGGTSTISYSFSTGCGVTFLLSVNSNPSPITGITTTCIGTTDTLYDSSPGGYWSSGSTGIATVDELSGAVTGEAAGVTAITYTYITTGCSTATGFTVNPTPGAIVGVAGLCAGGSTYLGDPTAGGTWSSSNTTVATVDPSAGNVSGLTAGTATISYTIGTGCAATEVATVNPLPPAITGSSALCVGLSATLADGTGGGTWSALNTYVATIDSLTGTITGVSTGTTTITYTLPTGCYTTKTITINTSPGTISGTLHLCPGATTVLTDATAGGTWTSSNSAVATIGATTGTAGAITPGTTVITYSLGAGCSGSVILTVNPLPGPITGTLTVCAGSATTLSDPGGGTWSSGNTVIATAVAITGTITGAAAGTTIITYTLPTGCTATKTVTVNPLPGAISGTLSLCSGAGTILSCLPAGGTWSSSITTIATINATTGAVTASGPGTTIITYTLPTGCTTTKTLTVTPLPAAITGTMSMCAGAGTTLADPTTGGTWSSSPAGVATTDGTATIWGAAAGTATVTYTAGGCSRTATVTVTPTPVITGASALCAAATITESGSPAGGTWSSGTPGAATITATTGIISGVAIGTTTITYTLPTGCSTTKTVTVSLSPVTITGAATVCAGATTTLTDAVSGGTWTSSNPSAATIGSLTGVVTGLSPGTGTTITYSLGSGCTVTTPVVVIAAPAGISGTPTLCAGTTTLLSDATGGGTWSSSTLPVATITAAGTVTGITAGTDTITYTHGGCAVWTTVTVTPAPGAITGATGVCAGAATALSETTGGGMWTSSSTTVATIDGSGTVWGATAGTATVVYTLGGCTAATTVTVHPIAAITGPAGLCVATTVILADGTTGGSWTATAGAAATVNSTGTVTGVSAGTAAITYTTGYGCMATQTETVNAAPVGITGNRHLCQGDTATLADAAAGGTWSSSSITVATATAITGIISGAGPGTATITYSLGSGCTTYTTVTVSAAPPAITGTSVLCAGTTAPLSETLAGAWSCSPLATATVSSGGLLSAVAAGVATVGYTAASGCITLKTVTVNTTPEPVTGAMGICTGLSTTLSDVTGGGTWSSSNPAAATITSAGTVTGITPGTATIAYTLPGGCATTTMVTIYAAPPPITGVMSLCTGATAVVADGSAGGSWSVATGTVATVVSAGTPATGIVTGVTTGTETISYILGGCPATATVTVNALPPAITGPGAVCAGQLVTLADAQAGGTWSSPGGLGVISVGPLSGVITGESAGTTMVTYSMGAGCTTTRAITVNALPPAITGTGSICAGMTTSLSDTITGGTWGSSDIAIATILPSGLTTGGAGGGIATITYTLPTGCYTLTAVMVTAVPPIEGANHVCAYGDTIHLADSLGGGDWSSTLVTISSSGVVTGFASGIGTVTYTIPSGCYTTMAITVAPLPDAITGSTHLCISAATSLADATAGGAWSSGAAAIATINTTGTVTPVTAGETTISYTMPVTGCRRTVTVDIDPEPHAGTISGAPQVCTGATIALTETVAGGAWSSSAPATATVDTTGTVAGLTAGTATITYSWSNLCGTADTTKAITVNTLPDAGVITGAGSVCTGATMPLSETVAGGTWSVAGGGITVSATGVVTGALQGTDTIIYTVSNMCGSTGIRYGIAVNTLPAAGTIAAAAGQLCVGWTDSISATPVGGTWSTANADVTITNGVITAAAAGTDTIYYTLTNDCGQAAATLPVTILSANVCDTGAGTANTTPNTASLDVYPNPNDGTFTVLLSSQGNEPVVLTVTNIVGEKVKQYTTTANKATVIQLNQPAGVYFLSAATAQQTYVVKVVVVK